MTPLERVQELVGHTFADPELLERALTHTSYVHENKGFVSNERLEFLGDAILQSCSTILLFHRFPNKAEGALSRFRSHIVNTEILASLGTQLDLGPALRLGKGEERTGGRTKVSLLANASEAVLGALYLDAGFQPCFDILSTLLNAHLDTLHAVAAAEGTAAWKDPRSKLQEETQARWQTVPTYEVTELSGPAHAPTFLVQVSAEGNLLGQGEGGSKREAIRLAAVDALLQLDRGTLS